MIQRLFSLILLLTATIISSAAGDGSVLDKASARLNKAKSIVATYKIKAEGHTMNGNLTVSKNRFVIDSPQVKSWFDGKTQWTYSAEIGEVNITEPTDEELAQVNPFAILNSFRTNFRTKVLKKAGDKELIEMTPVKKSGDITKLLVTVNSRTFFPTQIVIYMNGSAPVTIDIVSANEGQLLPDSHFRFDRKKFPGVEVVDLR